MLQIKAIPSSHYQNLLMTIPFHIPGRVPLEEANKNSEEHFKLLRWLDIRLVEAVLICSRIDEEHKGSGCRRHIDHCLSNVSGYSMGEL